MLFAGSILEIMYDGPRSISIEAQSVPIFSNIKDVTFKSIGTASK